MTVSGQVSVSQVGSGSEVFLMADGTVVSTSPLAQNGHYSLSCSFASAGQKTLVVGFTSTGSYADKSNVYSKPVIVTVKA